jgi:spore maturation protein SpmA
MVLNYIWIGFIVISFIVALFRLILFYINRGGYIDSVWLQKIASTGVFQEMGTAAFATAKVAVMDIGLPLAGIIIFFLGIMKIGEKAGVVAILAKLIDPFFRRLFPEIPKNHPAQGHIIMNFAANMLGLDNAATPMGLKAMQEMQNLNVDKETASNAQIMFLVLNTSGLTLIPINIMAQRQIMNAANPSDIFIPLLIATFFSTLAGLTYVGIRQKINFLDPVFLAYLLGACALVGGVVFYFMNVPPHKVSAVSGLVSNFILLSLIVSFVGLGFKRKIDVFSTFIEGAKDGFDIILKLLPYLVALLVGIALFRTCGALEFLLQGLRSSAVGIANLFGYIIDTRWIDAMPTAFMKPLSGGGARAAMLDTMRSEGPDSLAGRLSCIFQGAADTTFFIIAVYFGSVGIKKTRYSVAGGLIADLAGVLAAIWVAYLFFGNSPT